MRRERNFRNNKTFLLILFFASFLSLANSIYPQEIPDFQTVKKSILVSDMIIYDKNRNILHEIRNNKWNRRLDWVSLDKISIAVIHSLLIAEDRRFFDHKGVDWKALADGAFRFFTFRSRRGGSTLTMQLASFLNVSLKGNSGGRTFTQKLDQILYAQKIEQSWTKEEILEAYLNLANFKGELVGIEAASRALFQKQPHGLDEMEASIIVSFFKSPSGKESRIADRACYIASELEKKIDCDKIKEKVKELYRKNYFIKPKYDLIYHLAHSLIRSGKQELSTTIDLEIQNYARETLYKQLMNLKNKNVKDGSVIVLENATGNILAYVGGAGKDASSAYEIDGILSRRQAGSTLKPFVYALALEKNLIRDTTIINDNPIDIQVGTGIYSPSNYQGDFHGDVTARVALASSLNVPAVKVLSMMHLDDFTNTLESLGFTELREANFYGLSIALGSIEINLKELTNAYRTLANDGFYSDTRVLTDDPFGAKVRVFSEETADTIKDILSDKEARALIFGLENPLVTRFKSSVKTGTSKDMRDNWCVGFNSRYTVGVWVGNFSGEPMWNVSGVTGAAPVWRDILNYLSSGEINISQVEAKKKDTVFIPTKNPSALIKIIHPVNQSIFAIDPDIPDENQALYFEANKIDKEVFWMLNGKRLSDIKGMYFWKPISGKYKLAIVTKANKILDQIEFTVR